jgi:hypothetical protein
MPFSVLLRNRSAMQYRVQADRLSRLGLMLSEAAGKS